MLGKLSSVFETSSNTKLILVAVGIATVAWLYTKLLPTPIPGIPYNKDSARSIFGDVRKMFSSELGSMDWLVAQTEKHNSPLVQIMQPAGTKPFVLLADFRESQDILMRRSEFDRADGIAAFYSGIIPTFHMNYKTGPKWKAKRRLLQDLMSPGFLNDVAAPDIHSSVGILIDLWKEKLRIADGRPFSAGEDIKLGAFDAILAFSFGQRFPTRALTQQLDGILASDDAAIQAKRNTPSRDTGIKWDYITNTSEQIEALLHVTEWIGDVVSSPWSVLTFPLKLMAPSFKKIALTRALVLKDQAVKAGQRLEAGDEVDDGNDGIKSAVDLMVKREKQIAEKEGREPKYWSQSMHDETLGFLLAGHDTSAATEQWAVKFLSNNQTSQKKLRDALRTSFSDAVAEGRVPSAKEIAKSNIPYLDAFIEETLRRANSVFGAERQAMEDTTILGQHIPKGTMVFMVNKGHSFTKPGFAIDESSRSNSAQQAAKERGLREWDPEDMEAFKPERWLTKDEEGQTVFNLTAGPTLPFGLGIRGCFGRRLAYLGIRLTITLLVWNFDFQEVPKELAGYEAVDGLTHLPKYDYIRLQPAV